MSSSLHSTLELLYEVVHTGIEVTIKQDGDTVLHTTVRPLPGEDPRATAMRVFSGWWDEKEK
jgi:hypothetical protein